MTGSDATLADGAVVTITDVANAAGVSIRTVSRVLNGSPKVGEATRKDIQGHIDRLGFSPNSRARGLAAGRSFLLGVVQDDPNAHVIGVLQRGIVEVCSQRGYELVVHPSSYDDPEVVRNVRDFVRRSRVDGIIMLPPVSELERLAAELRAMRVPTVGLASVRVADYPSMLVSDERGAARTIGRHLADLGHRRIAFVSGPLQFRSSTERIAGFLEVLRERGIEVPSHCQLHGDYGFRSGLEAARTLLESPVRPTAIFAGNDVMAAGVMKAASEAGVAVPADLSVVGFDDSDIAAMLTPALSTIRRPLADMARSATERLLQMIAGGDAMAADQQVELGLITRDSTARPRPD